MWSEKRKHERPRNTENARARGAPIKMLLNRASSMAKKERKKKKPAPKKDGTKRSGERKNFFDLVS